MTEHAEAQNLFHAPEQETPVADRALVLHRYRQGQRVVTDHQVYSTPTGPVIGAGQLISSDSLLGLADDLRASTARQKKGLQLFDARLLGAGSNYAIWRIPGRLAPMWFRTGEKIEERRVPWPNLVAVATGGRLYLAATRSGNRPGPNTRLYHAPLMNVWATTQLCTGSAPEPGGCSAGHVGEWEHLLRESAFSHVNHPHTLAIGKEVSTYAHLRFWRGLARDGERRFPKDALVPLDQTLSQWLESIS